MLMPVLVLLIPPNTFPSSSCLIVCSFWLLFTSETFTNLLIIHPPIDLALPVMPATYLSHHKKTNIFWSQSQEGKRE